MQIVSVLWIGVVEGLQCCSVQDRYSPPVWEETQSGAVKRKRASANPCSAVKRLCFLLW